MMGLLQRVRQARVEVAGEVVGQIGPGLLALVCAEQGDGEAEADRLLAKLLKLRIFADAAGKMNLSLQDVAGGLLIVSQFTLAADTAKGMRPSFTTAAAPEQAMRWFEALIQTCRDRHPLVETGEFGAHMVVSLVNDGPVTFMLHS